MYTALCSVLNIPESSFGSYLPSYPTLVTTLSKMMDNYDKIYCKNCLKNI